MQGCDCGVERVGLGGQGVGCGFGVGDVGLEGIGEGLGDGLEEGVLFWVWGDGRCGACGCEGWEVELEGGC